MADTPAPVTPLAVRIIRAAMATAEDGGDVFGLAVHIRRQWLGMSRMEKLRVITAVAMVAAHLARQLPADEREKVFRLAEKAV